MGAWRKYDDEGRRDVWASPPHSSKKYSFKGGMGVGRWGRVDCKGLQNCLKRFMWI